MRFFKALLYSLIFSYSSLFSLQSSPCPVAPEGQYFKQIDTNTMILGWSSVGFSEHQAGTSWYQCINPYKFVFYDVGSFNASTKNYENTNTFTFSSFESPICAPPQILNEEGSLCIDPPSCPLNEIWNNTSKSCECDTGFARNPEGVCSPDGDGDGTPDDCDIDHPNFFEADCDGDGDPNLTDPDYDGDGITDGDTSGGCSGPDKLSASYYPSKAYDIRYMSYDGIKPLSACTDRLILANIDYVAVAPDKSTGCEDEYCYIHELVVDCNLNPSDYMPSGSYEYRKVNSESHCYTLIDNVKYSIAIWNTPKLSECPNTAFCYLKLIDEPEPDTNDEDTDDTMEHPDLNSTSQDNQALLQSQNTTNKHLQDLKDKTDITNDNLDDLKESSNKLLANNKSMNENLDKLNLNSKQSLKNQLDNISSLDGIKKGINSSNDLALNSNQKLSDVNNELDNITNNTHVINESLIDVNENLNDGLFTDTDPFEDLDLTDDGSDNFGDFENTIKDNMGFTYQNNMFGLAQAGSSGLVTISFSFYGKTMTIFQPSMMNGFPMASIRNLFLFFFALAGFITVFRTT